MNSNRNFYRALHSLIIGLIFSTIAFAQTTNGTLNGTVTDQNGAFVPGAQVTITQMGTAQKRIVTTNSDGHFSASNIPAATYEVTVSANGFLTSIAQNVVVEVGQELGLNFQLKIGDVKSTVVVEADQVQVATTNSALNNVVNGQTVRELPINGRDHSGGCCVSSKRFL